MTKQCSCKGACFEKHTIKHICDYFVIICIIFHWTYALRRLNSYMTIVSIFFFYMTLTWLLHDSYMALTWLLHGSYMALTWLLHGSYMALTWLLHGSYMTLTWLLHGSQPRHRQGNRLILEWCLSENWLPFWTRAGRIHKQFRSLGNYRLAQPILEASGELATEPSASQTRVPQSTCRLWLSHVLSQLTLSFLSVKTIISSLGTPQPFTMRYYHHGNAKYASLGTSKTARHLETSWDGSLPDTRRVDLDWAMYCPN
jgi:hypothetical protein